MVENYLLPSAFAQSSRYLDNNAQSAVLDLTRQLSEHNLEYTPANEEPHSHLFARRWSFGSSASSSRTCISSTAVFTEEPPASTSLVATHFASPSTCSYADHSAGSIRRQRQRALRSQCSTSHLDAISALVTRMMEKGEQCSIKTASVEEEGDCSKQSEKETMKQDNKPENIRAAVMLKPGSLQKHSTRSCVAKDSRARKHAQTILSRTTTMKR